MGPAYSRFAAVEIVKGSGQILYGPHTTSGLVNFKSRTPNPDGGGSVHISADTFSGYRGMIGVDIPLADGWLGSADI